MDEFGVLTERYGIKPQGKSAPLASIKRSAGTNTAAYKLGSNSTVRSRPSPNSWNSSSVNDFPLDDRDVLFQSATSHQKPQNAGGLGDDFGIFGGFQNISKSSNTQSTGSSFDYDSIFANSNNSPPSSMNFSDGDIFGGLSSSNSVDNNDVFGSFSSVQKQNDHVDDLLGGLGMAQANMNSRDQNGGIDVDDLITGFGGHRPQTNRDKDEAAKSIFTSPEDPFLIFEKSSSLSDPLEEFSNLNSSAATKPIRSSNGSLPLKPPPKPGQILKTEKVKISGVSSIEELEDFAMASVRNKAAGSGIRHGAVGERPNPKASKYKEAEDATQPTQQKSADYLDSFFSMGPRSSTISRATNLDSYLDSVVNFKKNTEVAQRTSNMKKATSAPSMVDDMSLFFGEATRVSEQFEEVEGENEERRRARLGRYTRTQDRVERAVADMNQRDYQNQLEQAEKRQIADSMDADIKRWAAGKETNMRALLSSLQLVLWPECGWEQVSLTDLITSTSVKKVYRKATLYVHPDKVQQKGATLQQKYIAEKVFDILKEAWNKFSADELS